MNLLQAMRDPKLFGPWFKDETTWAAWRAFLGALFGLPMSDAEAKVYQACTGRSEAPEAAFTEAWLICGRRAGKSFVLALIATYLATFREYRANLAPGERATILIIATDRRQARTIIRYIRALLTEVPMLARMVERETADEFDLTNRVTIEVGTSSYRAVRGRTLAAALADELAFWPTDDAAEPDYAILDALRPAMATIPNAMLLCASSPYARRGALYDAHRRYYGRDGAPALVWQAATRTMNPTVRQSVIDEALERDLPSASAEYLAQFRSDVESFVSREVVEAAVPPGITERSPVTGVSYRAFTDPSGGASDSMTLAISHQVGERVVLDLVRERKAPFSPESVVTEFAGLLKRYGLNQVTGDRYAGEWPREAFKRHGITYVPAEQPKSAIYLDLLPKLNSGEVELLDVPALAAQLVSLERRTARGGRDSIDHAPGSHDDVANAVAGALVIRTQSAPVAQVGSYQISRYGSSAPRIPEPPDWFVRGDRYAPGDPRWKLDIAKGLVSRDEAIAKGWIREA
ncbi:hypothetical protein [Methylobacterium sp. 391_Methyba4]|uniref:hypothetical protein n=1 Tax=Methylobacterium sp. 391_Methyba4 TaxID=3038924 RepID=UPI00241ED4F6|nr:hypothetical protein [Methylobacterium sp. 391_Methyba4]WFS10366.1 hypothetical protein P9K36_14275 [Methylobacterium sp. 391_Methyba4]